MGAGIGSKKVCKFGGYSMMEWPLRPHVIEAWTYSCFLALEIPKKASTGSQTFDNSLGSDPFSLYGSFSFGELRFRDA